LGHNLEDVTFHGRDHGRDYVRDDGRSVKEVLFLIICITMNYKFYGRDVRFFGKYNSNTDAGTAKPALA
jgi:hypothetical protein